MSNDQEADSMAPLSMFSEGDVVDLIKSKFSGYGIEKLINRITTTKKD